MFCPYTTLPVHKPHLKIHGFGQAVKYNSVCGQDMCRELREWGSNTLECKEGFLK